MSRFLRIDMAFLEDARFIEFSKSFTSINLAVGAWFRAAALVGGTQKKRVYRNEWSKADLPPELLKDLFVRDGDYVYFVAPTYTGTEGVKSNAKMTPHDLMDIWNAHRGSLPKALELSESRYSKAKKRVGECDDKEVWIKVVQWLAKSEFHTGRNDRGWKADFAFLLRPETRLKIQEKLERTKTSIEDW